MLVPYRYPSRWFVYVIIILANVVLIGYYVNSKNNNRTVSDIGLPVSTTVSPSVLGLECSPERQDVMFQHVDATYELVGKTELRQYNRFVSDHPGFKLMFGKVSMVELPSQYRYQISLASNSNVTGVSVTRITIVELDGDTPTRGGSSFVVTSDSVSRQLCSYDDLFNGTYFVTCPSPNFGCRSISIRLQYFNFTAYTGNHVPIGKVLWKQCVCNWQESTDATSHNSRLGTWYRSRDTWTLKTFNGQHFYPLAADTFCECVKKYDRLIFIGSSHMRYKANYVMYQCFDMPQRYLPRDFSLTIGNIQFVYMSKSGDYAYIWEDKLQGRNLTERDVVIFQTGAHDMADFGIQETVGRSLDTYVDALTDIAKHSTATGFRMLVLTSPPFPDADVRKSKGSRNNFALAAYARAVLDRLAPLVSRRNRVRLFDEFGLLVPQQERISCGCHYVCYSWSGKENSVAGDVGITAVYFMMVNYVC